MSVPTLSPSSAGTPAPRSLRRQLLLTLLLPLTMVWTVSAIAVYYFAVSFAQLAYDRALFDSALDISGQIRVVGHVLQVDLPRAALDMIESSEPDRVYYAVTGPRGNFVAGHRGLPPPPDDGIVGKPILYDGRYGGLPVRIAALLTDVKGDPEDAPVLVQVAETLNKRRALSGEILAGTLALELLLIGLAASVVWRGVKSGLRPLDTLSREIRNRSHRDLSPLPEAHAPGEVRPLIQAMNDLLSRLSGALSAQSRFIADAAHQLRTPLAGIRMQTELALREAQQAPARAHGANAVATGDHTDIQRTLAQLDSATEHTTHLINQLLSLARAEPDGARAQRFTRLDLAALVRNAAMLWVPRALARNIDLGVEATADGAWIDGDPLMLGELLTNLFDNAVRYTPVGGQVTARVDAQDNRIRLRIEDNGPGIPEAERALVFERFHRVLGTGVDGVGLGLAIVREIAESHTARIALGSGRNGQGTGIEITFPAA